MGNKLASSRSPYLLQHAHNPVEWWPWCEEAFAEARRRDVPVFLSVGYSACYWCHVMERESFENAAIARTMNERLVCVKVDREERPDVDNAYMAAVQMLTGQGGWPMSVFLMPTTLEPFWGGTYFPPVPAMGRPGFAQVCEGMANAWAERRGEVEAQAKAVAEAVRQRLGVARPAAPLGVEDVQRGVAALLTMADRTNGGFGGAPKFPQPVYARLLLAARGYASDEAGRAGIDAVLRQTLDAMMLGGVHDQVGGGFHRYAVDSTWTVPHFEKMLYDNAQLLELYAEASVVFGDALYARTARRIGEYVAREMTCADGAGAGGLFWTAQDAEVDGREGLNYLWTPDEVNAALAQRPGDAAWARGVLGLEGGPNFQDPHHPQERPTNVLRLSARPVESDRLDAVCAALLVARDRRKGPRLDDKVLMSWNGQMIGALATAGALLGDAAMVDRARRAGEAALRVFAPVGGGHWRRVAGRDGAAQGRALLEDYAYLASGLLALARVDDAGRARWLKAAEELATVADGLMGDGGGGYFDAEREGDGVFVRARTAYDGAMPCGQSVMLGALIDLYELTEQRRWLERALGALEGVSAEVAESPVSAANSTRGLLRLLAIDGAGVAAMSERAAAAMAAQAEGAGARVLAGTGSESVVQIMADLGPGSEAGGEGEVVLAVDEPAELWLRLEIAEGYHINDAAAAEASGGRLVPLRVDASEEGAGLAVWCDYPEGDRAGELGHGVLTGTVDLRVVLERTERTGAAAAGVPALVMSFQACTETECLAPARVRLEIPMRWAES